MSCDDSCMSANFLANASHIIEFEYNTSLAIYIGTFKNRGPEEVYASRSENFLVFVTPFYPKYILQRQK